MKNANDALKNLEKKEKIMKEFGDLIDTIESADEKKKFLWKQIYNNAVSDRESVSVLYTNLFTSMISSNEDHNMTGPMLVKYLERMGKCTEQLIKLAEMIDSSESKKTSPEDMYDAIQEN